MDYAYPLLLLERLIPYYTYPLLYYVRETYPLLLMDEVRRTPAPHDLHCYYDYYYY